LTLELLGTTGLECHNLRPKVSVDLYYRHLIEQPILAEPEYKNRENRFCSVY
jgi:hypothetical protein